ncbi:MAG: hypothetical protein MJZ30_05960 [Paludibacteraceae bacterium]|nr:hypothetical protein [Paludibacteraceae bacterium]
MPQRKIDDIEIERLADLIAAKIADKVALQVSVSIKKQLDIDSASHDKLLSAKEAAAKLGISKSTFCTKRVGDTLPSIVLPGGIKRFPESRIIPHLLDLL